MYDTFVEEGANYPYRDNPEPLITADKLVPRFEIFAEHVNTTKEPTIEEPMVEELVLTQEREVDMPVMEQKDTND